MSLAAANVTPDARPERAPAPTPSAPLLVIGRIDVIVEAPPPVPARAPANPSRNDASSRYYLRRL